MKAYTLIEVVIAVLLLSIILLGGTTLFYQNLRSSGVSEVTQNLNSALRDVMTNMERDIRFSTVISVGTGNRIDCTNAGDAGYGGDFLEVSDLNGLITIYASESGKIASTSADTNQTSYISPADIKIDRLYFIWYCRGNVSDKIKISIDASSVALGSGITVSRSVSDEVDLLNSGIR